MPEATKRCRGGESGEGGLDGGSAGRCEGTFPREATLAAMLGSSLLGCWAIKRGLGFRPAGKALLVPGLAAWMQEGISSSGHIG